MKKSKLLLAVSALATVTSLVGCSKTSNDIGGLKTTNKLSIEDYVVQSFKDVAQNDYARDALTSQKVGEGYDSVPSVIQRNYSPTNYVYLTKTVDGETKKTVYNKITGNLIAPAIVNPSFSIETVFSYNYSTNYYLLEVETTNQDLSSTYSYYYEDGTIIASNLKTSSSVTFTDRQNSKGEKFLIVTLQNDNSKTYFKIITDKNNNTTLLPSNQDEYNAVESDNTDDDEYAVGSNPFTADVTLDKYFNIDISEGEKLPESLKDYKVREDGHNLIFTKGGKQTGVVSLEYTSSLIGSSVTPVLLQNYLYYVTCVNQDVLKADYKIHKYDIVKNSDSEIKSTLAISSIGPLLNVDTQYYDAAIISGNKTVDGCIQQSATFSYLVDSNFNFAYDLTWAGSSFDFDDLSILKKDEKYIYGSGSNFYVLDNKLQKISMLNNVRYIDDNTFVFQAQTKNGSCCGLCDATGKIILSPKCSTIYSFYGDYAYAYKIVEGTSNLKEVLIKKDGTEIETEESTFSYSEPPTESGTYYQYTYNENGYVEKREMIYDATATKQTTYNYKLTDYSGNVLISKDDILYSSARNTSDSAFWYIPTDKNSNTYDIYIIK